MTWRLLDPMASDNWPQALGSVQTELQRLENGTTGNYVTWNSPYRWNFTSVHRDGQRKRVVERHVAWIQICAGALKEAIKTGAALEIERMR